MRRPLRNIEIFSMSVLDMFAFALGAFIMCSVIFFPFYQKDIFEKAAAAKAALQQKTVELTTAQRAAREIQERIRRQQDEVQQVRDTQANLNICKQGINQCQVALAKTFLLVQIEWDKQVDVDLHVTDPDGNEFYWAKSNKGGRDFPLKKAQLSVDSTGKGFEMWIDPEAKPGSYKVDYALQRPLGEDVAVTGTVIDRLGKGSLGQKILARGERRIRAAELEIAADARLKIR